MQYKASLVCDTKCDTKVIGVCEKKRLFFGLMAPPWSSPKQINVEIGGAIRDETREKG